MTTAIAFLPDRNTRGRDYSGAFLPCARDWSARWGADLIMLDPTAPASRLRAQTLAGLERIRPPIALEQLGGARVRLAWFCHGFTRGIQLGWDRAHVVELARAIARTGAEPVISLFCCSTGGGPGVGGDGGFADTLRDALCREGAAGGTILAHAKSGHAARCPYKRRFDGTGSTEGGQGGTWVVPPGSPLWRRWVAAMRTGDLWQEVAELSPAQLHERIKHDPGATGRRGE